ncbi:MAG TPA: RluA family pseudouridine synthase [Terriglobales bacterium]|nr:RluA family pseudouridine synthase [Terriglobales bacterium]
MPEQNFPTTIRVPVSHAGERLDRFLVSQVPEVSRACIQQLIAGGKVRVNGDAAKPSLRLREGDQVELLGSPQHPPLKAFAEDIPLDVVYEDDALAVINKPAGMVVHAGAGARSQSGTLVNALLHRFGPLSGAGGELRPGIVHRLDKDTSGLIVVAKNDLAHRRLAEQFARREVKKRYIALIHGWIKQDRGTVAAAIARDRARRTRMTTRTRGGREAVSHWRVLRRIQSRFGKFSLLEIKIDTGRTHQIRVHLASLGHPVVGDSLYGSARELKDRRGGKLALGRNFLHAAAIELKHPTTGSRLGFSRPLPAGLENFLSHLDGGNSGL